jgi:hypothetical protein
MIIPEWFKIGPKHQYERFDITEYEAWTPTAVLGFRIENDANGEEYIQVLADKAIGGQRLLRLEDIRPVDRRSTYYTEWLKPGREVRVRCHLEQDWGWLNGFTFISWDGAHSPNLINPSGCIVKVDINNIALYTAPTVAKVDTSRYPHKCPRCGGAAYVGFGPVECLRKCS